MRRVFVFILSWCVTILLLPVLMSIAHSFSDALLSQNIAIPRLFIAFAQGVVVYTAVHLALWKPRTAYLFGHEMLHRVLMFCMCRWRVVGARGPGTGRATREPVLAVVTPALVPVYTIMLTLVCNLLRAAGTRLHTKTLVFIVGISVGFHLLMAIDILQGPRARQTFPTYLVTIECICLSTLLITALCFASLLPSFSLGHMLQQAVHESGATYSLWFHKAFSTSNLLLNQ